MKSSDGKAGAGTLYGTLEVLVLKTLSEQGSLHGLEIARSIERRSADALKVEEGALYPALHRMQRQGLIDGEWRISDKRRRARFYVITDAGTQTLESEIRSWTRHAGAVMRVLGLAKAD